MKKRIALLLSTMLVVSGVLAGCGGSVVATTEETKKEETQEETTEDVATDGALKLGLAISTDISGSTDAGEEDGLAQTNISLAAVTVDSDGKIVSCVIDEVQGKINFSAEGKIVTDLATEFQSKQELKEDYGMKKASPIGKEWNEQADAFAEYCIGKTADEVMGIAVTEEGVAADEDLAASCTVHIGGFQAIVAKAVENAK